MREKRSRIYVNMEMRLLINTISLRHLCTFFSDKKCFRSIVVCRTVTVVASTIQAAIAIYSSFHARCVKISLITFMENFIRIFQIHFFLSLPFVASEHRSRWNSMRNKIECEICSIWSARERAESGRYNRIKTVTMYCTLYNRNCIVNNMLYSVSIGARCSRVELPSN